MLYKIYKLILIVFVLCAGWPLFAKDITILFTHDLHSMFLPHRVMTKNGNVEELGSYARLYTLIKQARQARPEQTIVVDAGDFSSGSFFYTLFSTDCAELQLMARMGYDVTTLGNHDFDFGPIGLADALVAAKKTNLKLPEIVASNVKSLGDAEDLINLNNAFQNYGVKEYVVLERNGVRIGLFGLLGDEAIEQAPEAVNLFFENKYTAAKRIVKKLRDEEKTDVIVCLSHSGTNIDKTKSEDELLAKKISGIDVIISGHSHTPLQEPIMVNKTIIASAGCYANYLGELIFDTDTKILKNYRLIAVDATLPADSEITASIDLFRQKLDANYFCLLHRSMNDTVIFSRFYLPMSTDSNGNSLVGNLVADAFAKVSANILSIQNPIAVVPAGTLRDNLYPGYSAEAHLFNILSLGVGPDRKAGYPLVCIYLTGKELWDLCEINTSVAPLMPEAQLSFSGLRYTYNPHRLFCNRVTQVEVLDSNGNLEKADENKLYPVVASWYSAQMLDVVSEKTHGVLLLQPKDEAGQPVKDYLPQVIKTQEGLEMKEWLALSNYIHSLATNGKGAILPDHFAKYSDYTVLEDDATLGGRLKQPNIFAMLFYGVGFLFVFILIFLVIVGIRKWKRHE